MLALLYTDSYALGFKIEIMINFDIWIWNFILDGLMYTILKIHSVYYWSI